MTKPHHLDPLEPRRLFSHYPVTPPRVDLRADVDRDGVITFNDNQNETDWVQGPSGRGATVLPNVDRDNTTTDAPDNWTGGNWNGKHVGANNVIDNAADLADIARLRLMKLVEVDASYRYTVTLRLLPGTDDPDWLDGVAGEDRVRVFMPSQQISRGRVILQPGDSAILGPGVGSEIRFVNEPKAANEFPLSLLRGEGYLELGVEGLKMGATVKFELVVEYEPVRTFFSLADEDPFNEEPDVLTDTLTMRVAPFTILDHRSRVSQAPGSVYVDRFNENVQMRKVLRDVFGDRLIEGNTGDIWQQDGCEIGYVDAGYARLPVVLELPRSRGEGFEGGIGIRAFLRGRLLGANVGVSTEVAAFPNDSSSMNGGDIEALPNPADPTGPSLLLRSAAMPTYLKQFFDAQNVNPAIEINPDRWLAVGHADEVVHLSPDGRHVMMPDADLGYAMLLLAHQLNPRARMHAGVGGAEYMPGYTPEGLQIADFLRTGRLRRLNLEKVMDARNLPAIHRTIVRTLGLDAEVSTPRDNTTSASLSQAGVVAQLLRKKRYFEVTFVDSVRYELRYRDAGGEWSAPQQGSRDADAVFAEARAYLFPKYFSGTTQAGDTFTFQTNADPTFIRMPITYVNNMTFQDFGTEPVPDGFEEEALLNPCIAFTMSTINSLSDGDTIIAAMSYGPRVNYAGLGKQSLFDDYAARAFEQAGYDTVRFVDARFYHNGSGGVHCGTNVFRDWTI